MPMDPDAEPAFMKGGKDSGVREIHITEDGRSVDDVQRVTAAMISDHVERYLAGNLTWTPRSQPKSRSVVTAAGVRVLVGSYYAQWLAEQAAVSRIMLVTHKACESCREFERRYLDTVTLAVRAQREERAVPDLTDVGKSVQAALGLASPSEKKLNAVENHVLQFGIMDAALNDPPENVEVRGADSTLL